jgi:hypothetical protein
MMVILAGMAAITLGTWIGAPALSPVVVGLAIGLGAPSGAAWRAALAAALAWGALLLTAVARGNVIGTLGATLGGAMGIPAWALFVATLLFPAILAASAAWLAHLVPPRRPRSIAGAATARDHQPT